MLIPSFSALYKGKLQAHFFKAADSAITKSPAILFFHGGGWVGGDASRFFRHAQFMSMHGITGVSVEYRVKKRDASTVYDSISDAVDAAVWVVNNAKQFGIDQSRLICCGGSAGGLLAFHAAIKVDAAALVLLNPVVNTSMNGFINKQLPAKGDSAISPLHILQNRHSGNLNTACLLLHCRDDKVVPVAQVEQFADTYALAGGKIDTVLLGQGGHGFFNRMPL